MPRRNPHAVSTAAPNAAGHVHTICPTAVYFADDARRILRLKQSTIRREVREGRLRIAKRAGRYYLLGEWILEWLRGGEVKRGKPNNDNGTDET
jgi:hypothetical protein